MGREDEVRCIAYSIWQEAGCPSGCDYEYWFKAESMWENKQEKSVSSNSKAQTKRTTMPRTKVATARKKTQKSQ
jgi:hypothetical protein